MKKQKPDPKILITFFPVSALFSSKEDVFSDCIGCLKKGEYLKAHGKKSRLTDETQRDTVDLLLFYLFLKKSNAGILYIDSLLREYTRLVGFCMERTISLEELLTAGKTETLRGGLDEFLKMRRTLPCFLLPEETKPFYDSYFDTLESVKEATRTFYKRIKRKDTKAIAQSSALFLKAAKNMEHCMGILQELKEACSMLEIPEECARFLEQMEEG